MRRAPIRNLAGLINSRVWYRRHDVCRRRHLRLTRIPGKLNLTHFNRLHTHNIIIIFAPFVHFHVYSAILYNIYNIIMCRNSRAIHRRLVHRIFSPGKPRRSLGVWVSHIYIIHIHTEYHNSTHTIAAVVHFVVTLFLLMISSRWRFFSPSTERFWRKRSDYNNYYSVRRRAIN